MVAVEAQARIHELQVAHDAFDRVPGRVGGGDGLKHLDGMATLVSGGAADWITQRRGEAKRWADKTAADSGIAILVECCAGVSGRTGEHTIDIGTQLLKFLVVDDAFEDVATTAPIGVENISMNIAFSVEADRAAIVEFTSALAALLQVGIHGRCVLGGRQADFEFCYH